MVSLSDLELALKDSWSEDTSSDSKNWSHGNPAWGQCAVTSLVANDYLGGIIVWASAKLPDGREISHYFNKIDDSEIDLTRSQFPEGTIIPHGILKTKQFQTTRDYILSYDITANRYEILKRKVKKFISSLP